MSKVGCELLRFYRISTITFGVFFILFSLRSVGKCEIYECANFGLFYMVLKMTIEGIIGIPSSHGQYFRIMYLINVLLYTVCTIIILCAITVTMPTKYILSPCF